MPKLKSKPLISSTCRADIRDMYLIKLFLEKQGYSPTSYADILKKATEILGAQIQENFGLKEPPTIQEAIDGVGDFLPKKAKDSRALARALVKESKVLETKELLKEGGFQND